MRKRLLIGLIPLVAAGALALSPAASAIANPANSGGAATAPGQEDADGACFTNAHRQFAIDLDAGGGPKDGWGPPTNCDHFFQVLDLIGHG